MILITSGAFISEEFQVELGKVPPSFIPLGNRRLYEHQVDSLRLCFPSIDLFLSVTDAYTLRESDRILLDRLNVKLIHVPDGLTLGDSILYVINSIGRYDETLRILHGDTLLIDFPHYEDIVALAQSEDGYSWELESVKGVNDTIWCGFFAFSDVKLLARSLTASRGRFVEAVRDYQRSRPQQMPIINNWFDLGHVNTYFRTRAKITTQRSFNDLLIENSVVNKSSLQQSKMEAEYNWYFSIPSVLKRYIPQLIDKSVLADGRFQYQIEYLPYLPLNELYVHANMQPVFWNKIFNLASKLMHDFSTAHQFDSVTKSKVDSDFHSLISDKTRVRFAAFMKHSGISCTKNIILNGELLPSLTEIMNHCIDATLSTQSMPTILHGDLCFSNILYDSRGDSLKVLDPRGINTSMHLTIFGDSRYDAAKFIHSVIGLYDHIKAGLFSLKTNGDLDFTFLIYVDDSTRLIQSNFMHTFSINGIGASELLPLVVLLFLSMLPLHSDNPDHQLAFLANACRLYSLWMKENL